MTSGARANPITDVAVMSSEIVVLQVESDSAENPSTVNDPTARAQILGRVQPINPLPEPLGCLDVVRRSEAKAILVHAGTPFDMRGKPCLVHADVGWNQLKHG